MGGDRNLPRAATIRNAARALIIAHECVLALRFKEGETVTYRLPGGGQEAGETLQSTVRRECVEEIGVAVDVHKLVFVREDLRARPHRVAFFFRCSLAPGAIPHIGVAPDPGQVGVEWLPFRDLP